ncbi:acyl-CoA synthetase [Ilumatobacter coccineus]|jgi:acyl-coenzyme A synthetase/AMP-(fatty) acid ligase|uniref:Fatty-acid--CoA ligase n=1 Tax=Ilumatobacter coccineus (strain NBRC 103263 / KCTC 29153 / YM16-304) TaxID=1313172 RepID=A0A6C7EA50_ILUCY|nr:acyl-CoA synthetase [Ilumatobacter coccineus]BAN02015.1 fatty-acid--CoA ligase [Ilumatobacter coccineus YM16-304]
MTTDDTYDEVFEWDVPDTFNFSADVVDRWADDPDRLALITVDEAGDERRYTYAEIARAASRLANLLADHGLRQGDRVIVMLPRIAEWQIAMVAATRMGAVPIPCITMLTASDLAYRVEHSDATAVICPSDDCAKFDGLDALTVRVAVGDAPDGWTSFAAADECSSEFEPATVAAEDPAILYYTSGSTGSPKGVTHPSRSLWAWANSAVHWLGLSPDERIWCTADTGWSKAGTSILFGPWSQGASVLFYDGPFVPAERFRLLERFEITCFCAAATELRRLILEDASGIDLSKLRSTVSAGESVNPEIIDRWREISGTTVLDGYGQTETLMTVTNRPGRPVKPGSMGRPLPGVDVAVRHVHDSGTETADASGSGELLIKLPNPQVMLGYWNDPDRTASTTITVGDADWFATGDNVEIDDDGYVFYTGRADDIINSAGYRIGPQEVENALIQHRAVQECAVVGVPDPERGELVKAWVVLNDGYVGDDDLVDELQAHAKATTAPYKYPRAISFADELPKTVTGKLRRNVLRAQG